jgi:transcriptional regulator with XRE-family HTH domain
MKATLKEWRGYRGISQEALARKVGVTAQTIRNWESRKTEPSVSDLPKLKRALSMRASDSLIVGKE